MLIHTISQYLESHKRLVVPQLGTFIVKEPGVSIVFSELLKRDDGTLRRLLIGGGPIDEPRVSISAKMAPDPSVRGLRYGKPPKNTDAYTYVDRPPRRRKADRFIWIALIAAALAVAAIAFGYLREAKDRETEMQYLEQPADTHTAASGDAAQPEQPITE